LFKVVITDIVFDFEDIKTKSTLNKEVLSSLNGFIKFVVVDEPSEGVDRECIDIATGIVSFSEISNSQTKVDLYCLASGTPFGSLSFTLTGLPDFATFMK
jgi:hypothetical protein